MRRTVSLDRARLMDADNTLVRVASAPTFKRQPSTAAVVTATATDDMGLTRTSSAERILRDRQRRASLNATPAETSQGGEQEMMCSPLYLGSPEKGLGMSPVAAMIASSSPPPPVSLESSPATEEKPKKKKKKKKESYKDMMAAMTVRAFGSPRSWILCTVL